MSASTDRRQETSCVRDRGLSRRELLASASALALAACRPTPYDPRSFVRPVSSPVAILPASSYASDLADVIWRGLRLLKLDVRGKRVFLKPNMVEYERDSAINTNAVVVAGAAHALLSAGAASVVVGEGPGHRRDIEYLITQTGLLDHLRDARLRFVDLNHDDVRWVKPGSRFMGVDRLALPVELLQCDFIVSMPKMKTHHWAGITASMKNLFGTVPGAVYGWPKNPLHTHGIENSIVDLVATVKPALAIVDAITAMEGDGPIMGEPRHVGCLIIGADLPAVDATCARVMGVDPHKLAWLTTAGRFLGNVDLPHIEQRGEPIERYRGDFALIEHFRDLRLVG